MGRLQSGRAPLCDTHYTYSLDCIVGVVTSADLEGDEGTAECRITRRDDRAGTVQDIVDGIIANVSVGYERSEEHTSELQSLMRISYAVFCLKQKQYKQYTTQQPEKLIINNK